MKNQDWLCHFPYSEPRQQQIESIDKILSSIKGKKFFILEAGTGVGKSAIGLTVAKHLQANMEAEEGFVEGTYFLTTQKILQDQYVKDFSSCGMKSVKSSANFSCRHHKKNTCAQSMRILKTAKKGSSFWNTCVFKCPYKKEKRDFIEGTLGVTNFPYFLAESNYARKIQPRNLLIVDEAHNIANELGKFIEITVTEKFSKDFLKINMPELKSHSVAVKWVKEIYQPKLSSMFKHMQKTLDRLDITSRIDEFTKLARQFELVDKHLCKINRFLQVHEKDNWVFNECAADGRKSRRLEFKPIDVAPFTEQMLFRFGRKVVMMSATILDKDGFCETLGLDRRDVEFLSIDSPFDPKNRPILFFPIGKMAKREIDNSLPKLVEAIEKIMENHKAEKGIIHCHTFKIANYIKKNISSRRLLIHNSDNRDEVLSRHKNSKKPTVLLSPSMTEGVDLAGDISRFQVVCKIPYPYLGDRLISKRMNKWRWWYPLQTAKTIVQSVGRSIRSEDDYAVTYILDSDWDRFYSRNYNLFPNGFRSCMK